MKKSRLTLFSLVALASCGLASAQCVSSYPAHDIGDGGLAKKLGIDNGMNDTLASGPSQLGHDFGHGGGMGKIDSGGYDGDGTDKAQPAGAIGKNDLDPLYGAKHDVNMLSSTPAGAGPIGQASS